MDFFLAILLLMAAILAGTFWKDIMNWALHKNHRSKK